MIASSMLISCIVGIRMLSMRLGRNLGCLINEKENGKDKD